MNFSQPHQTGENVSERIIFVDSLANVRPEQKRAGQIFYQTKTGEFFVWIEEQNDGETMRGIGGFFGKLAGIAAPFAALIPGVGQFASIGLSAVSALTQGQAGQARGLSQINAFGAQVIAAFDQLDAAAAQIASAPNPQMTAAQIAQEAQKLVAILSDSNAVYQAKKGKDAEALNSFKAQAQQRAQQVTAAAQAAENLRLQQTTQTTSGNLLGSPTSNPLIYAGLGIAAFLLLRKLL